MVLGESVKARMIRENNEDIINTRKVDNLEHVKIKNKLTFSPEICAH